MMLASWNRRRILELLFLRRTAQSSRGGLTARHGAQHLVEVAGPDLVLVLGCSVPHRLGFELLFLKFDIGAHAGILVVTSEVERAVAKRVPVGQSDELEAVA
jgi:hypothetical protein